MLSESLALLARPPPTFLARPPPPPDTATLHWLTRLIATDLHWLSSSEADRITASASSVLAGSCGRLAAPSMTRSFTVPRANGDKVEIAIHEPGICGDALGLKTWGTSFLLASRLHTLMPLLCPSADPKTVQGQLIGSKTMTAIELGAGTGLLGLSLSMMVHCNVILSDYLPEIIDNLRRNIQHNEGNNGSECQAALLDWTQLDACPMVQQSQRFDLVMASDPLYAPDHPARVINAALRLLRPDTGRLLIGYPLRPSNVDLVTQTHALLDTLVAQRRLVKVAGGDERGWDDWADDGIHVSWALFAQPITG